MYGCLASNTYTGKLTIIGEEDTITLLKYVWRVGLSDKYGYDTVFWMRTFGALPSTGSGPMTTCSGSLRVLLAILIQNISQDLANIRVFLAYSMVLTVWNAMKGWKQNDCFS